MLISPPCQLWVKKNRSPSPGRTQALTPAPLPPEPIPRPPDPSPASRWGGPGTQLWPSLALPRIQTMTEKEEGRGGGMGADHRVAHERRS